MTSSTSNFRLLRTAAWALLCFLLLNGAVAWRLADVLAGEPGSINDLIVFERRLEAFEAKERVRVLVLGNSHAVAGLRPPDLARLLGLEADEVFSLAVPGATAGETRILLEHYLARFPNVKVAVCGVDEFFLGRYVEIRSHFLTRHRLDLRLAWARRASTLDQATSRAVGWFFPLADYREPLKSLARRRLSTLGRPQPGAQDTYERMVYRLPYRWGYPPPQEQPATYDRWAMRARADMLADSAPHVGKGLVDLAGVQALLQAHGCRLVLAEMPVEPLLTTLASRRRPTSARAYHKRLGAFVAASGLPWVSAPDRWDEGHFLDMDHLGKAGAARLGRWVAPHLKPTLVPNP